MVRSMTGFAAAAAEAPPLAVGVEIRSTNSRFLDLAVRLPAAYPDLEERVRRAVSERILRGRVEVRIQVEEAAGAKPVVEADLPRARAVHQALALLGEALGLPERPTLAMLLAAGGILKTTAAAADPEAVWAVLEGCLARALDGLEAMRAAEGERLAADLTARLETIAAALREIRGTASELVPLYRQRLEARIAALTQGLVELDPGRVAQEAAFLADRADISEELVRAESHLAEFRRLLSGPQAAGRPLGFLLQELHREFNTMGAKVGSASASQSIVAVKSELEKIREQVQNLE